MPPRHPTPQFAPAALTAGFCADSGCSSRCGQPAAFDQLRSYNRSQLGAETGHLGNLDPPACAEPFRLAGNGCFGATSAVR
jgi:hypothetical protein